MVIGNQGFNTVNTFANRPSFVTAVHIVNKHLKMFMRLCSQRKFQTSVNRVSEFPNFCVCFGRVKKHRVFKQSFMFHLEILRAFERERFALKLTVRAYWDFNVFRERIVQR